MFFDWVYNRRQGRQKKKLVHAVIENANGDLARFGVCAGSASFWTRIASNVLSTMGSLHSLVAGGEENFF